MDRRFEDVDRRFEQVDQRFIQIDNRMGRLEDRMASLESKLDSRFGWQVFLTIMLGVIAIFGDVLRPLIGLG